MTDSPDQVTPPAPAWRPAAERARRWAWRWQVALLLIVAFGAILRFHGLGWDQPEGADTPLQMHPDERFISFVADGTRWPDSVGEWFDTERSTANPYNAPGINSYVYGTFPVYFVKAISDGYEKSPQWLKDTLGFVGLDSPERTQLRDLPADGGGAKGCTPIADQPQELRDQGLGRFECRIETPRYERNVIWGRRVTALFDTATIVLAFAAATVLFTRRIGLLAAFLYACAVLPTQLAHFWTMDPYVTFFATATLLCSALVIRAPTLRQQAVLAGVIAVLVGLGLASKVTAWPLVLLPVVAYSVRYAMRDHPRLGLALRGRVAAPPGHWANDLSFLCFAIAGAMVVFRIAQPHAFAGPGFLNMSLNARWRDDLLREVDFQNGNVDYPPFIQWANRTPIAWPLENMVLWGLGPALALAGFAAMVVAAVLIFKRREVSYVLPLALALAILGFQGPRFVAWMRYFAPMYPVVCMFAAWGLISLWDSGRNATGIFARDRIHFGRGRWQQSLPTRPVRAVAIAASLLVIQATVWWALAFQNIYANENPRLVASRWMYDNIPAGATVTSEIWDDSLPYHIPGYDSGQYNRVETEPFHPDSPQKVIELVNGFERNGQVNRGLNGADYVIISSHRVRGAVKQLPLEYPVMNRYYELLDSGELGFELIAHFELRPSFLGVTIDDSRADESFTVYDHPEVSIYQKTNQWDPNRAIELLNQAHPDRAENIRPRQGSVNGLLFTDEEFATQRNGGTFSDIFDPNGWASGAPWLWWFLWLELAAIASVPWVTWLFRHMPDRGYGLSKLAGFAGVGLITWLAVAWGAFHYSGVLVWAIFLGFIAAGAVIGHLRRVTIIAEARDHWRTVVAVETIFVLVFAAFLLMRAFNPDTWHHPQGGEKPMELGYLTAVTRSTILPPIDPWFGGGTMNYYYVGWFLLSVPIRALRIVPEVAFNLAIPTYAAMSATVAFSTVFNLVGLSAWRRAGERARDLPWRPLVWAGVLGSVLLIGIGNLDGLHQTIERFQQLNHVQGAPGEYHWGFASDVPFIGGLVGFIAGVYRWLFEGADLRPFDWWRSSRVHFGLIDITEFPFWSLLFADLHPHLMGVPFFGLVIAAGTAYVAACVRGLRGQAFALAALLGVAIGLVRMVHYWDYPTAVLLTVAAIVVGQFLRPGRWDLRFWDAVSSLVIAAGVLLVAFAPFSANFEVYSYDQASPDSTMAKLMPGFVESLLHRAGLIPAPETTPAQQHFSHFGLFLFATAAFLVARYWEELRLRDGDAGGNPVLSVVSGPWEFGAFALLIAGITAFTWRWDLTVVALSTMALIMLFNLLWMEFRRDDRDPARLIATGLLIGGVGIGAGVDIVTVMNDIERMNTVFKFSLQAWQLFALGSAYAAWYCGRLAWAWEGWSFSAIAGRKPVAIVFTAVAVFLFAGSMIFLYSGTRVRQAQRFVDTGPTLNGYAWMATGGLIDDGGTPDPNDDGEFRFANDKPLIDYLRYEVEGTPVIAEAIGGLYRWTGRMSWNTGLPAVIGWDWHQTQQRWDYQAMIQRRRIETDLFYKSAETGFARDYLKRYRVEYVVVGQAEYLYGSDEGVAKFAQMPELTEVFRFEQFAIYQVTPEFLATY